MPRSRSRWATAKGLAVGHGDVQEAEIDIDEG